MWLHCVRAVLGACVVAGGPVVAQVIEVNSYVGDGTRGELAWNQAITLTYYQPVIVMSAGTDWWVEADGAAVEGDAAWPYGPLHANTDPPGTRCLAGATFGMVGSGELGQLPIDYYFDEGNNNQFHIGSGLATRYCPSPLHEGGSGPPLSTEYSTQGDPDIFAWTRMAYRFERTATTMSMYISPQWGIRENPVGTFKFLHLGGTVTEFLWMTFELGENPLGGTAGLEGWEEIVQAIQEFNGDFVEWVGDGATGWQSYHDKWVLQDVWLRGTFFTMITAIDTKLNTSNQRVGVIRDDLKSVLAQLQATPALALDPQSFEDEVAPGWVADSMGTAGVPLVDEHGFESPEFDRWEGGSPPIVISQPIEFTIPMAGLGAGFGHPAEDFTVRWDGEVFAPFRAPLHVIFIAGVTMAGMARVWAELRRG